MPRMRIPAVALGLLLVIGAGLAGLLTFFVAGRGSVGWMWALVVFLGVLTACVVVAVTRANDRSQVEQVEQ